MEVAPNEPCPKEHVVANSIFNQVAGKKETVSLAQLSDFLIGRGDVPLDKIQTIFNTLECEEALERRRSPYMATHRRTRALHARVVLQKDLRLECFLSPEATDTRSTCVCVRPTSTQPQRRRLDRP